MNETQWTYLFVGLTFTLYLVIAWLSRVRDTRGFYVAGRGVPAIANGMATALNSLVANAFVRCWRHFSKTMERKFCLRNEKNPFVLSLTCLSAYSKT